MYHSICNMNRCSLVNGYEAEGNARPEPSSPPSNPSAALDRSSSESCSRAARFKLLPERALKESNSTPFKAWIVQGFTKTQIFDNIVSPHPILYHIFRLGAFIARNIGKRNVISIGIAFIKRHFDTLRVDRRTIRHTACTSLYLFR